MSIHVQYEMYSMKCTNNNVIIHISVLICNLSAAVKPCNYKWTDNYINFYSLPKYQMFNFTCDSILKYIDKWYVLACSIYPNIACMVTIILQCCPNVSFNMHEITMNVSVNLGTNIQVVTIDFWHFSHYIDHTLWV